ncbi:hypothetical protein [Nocardia colli]|uniref:hypothetical protein n=1 Tax=Nocardia colli TaxID=2545717 RepID=UPI0035D68FFB
MGGQDVSARKWARTVMARVLEAQMRAARATEADLVEFCKHAACMRRAVQRREVMIAAALERYEAIAAEAETAQGVVLNRLQQRGLDAAQLLEMTGLDVVELKRLRRIGAAVASPQADGGESRSRTRRSPSRSRRRSAGSQRAGNEAAQSGKPEQSTSQARSPSIVFGGPRPVPRQPQQETAAEPGETGGQGVVGKQHDSQ